MLLYYAISIYVIALAGFKPNTIINNKYTSKSILWAFILLTSILLLLNFNNFLYGSEAISDLVIYSREFLSYADLSLRESLIFGNREIFFTLFSWIIAQFTDNVYIYLIIIWLFITYIMIKSFKLIIKPRQIVLLFFSYVNFPFFFGYIVNGIRQGFAMSFLLLSLCLLINGNKKEILFISSLVLAILSHNAALPFALLLLLLRFYKKLSLKFSISVWIISSFLFLTGLNRSVLNPVALFIEPLAGYLSEEALSRYAGVNRVDFLLFSLIFIIIGVFFYNKLNLENKNTYRIILNSYILFNALFVLFGFIAFSNRLSTFSWWFIPIVIWYPIFKNEENQKTNSLLIISVVVASLIIGTFTSNLTYLF